MLTRILLCLIFTVSLSSCGFKLRGYADLPDHLNVLKISPNQPFEPFQRRLRQMLKQNQVQILPFSAEKITMLQIDSHAFKEDTISYAPDGTISRARLKFTVRYTIFDKAGKSISSSQTVESLREFNVSSNTLLSDQTERATLKEELWLETAHKMLRQLAL